jgi:hypothetical protein
VNPFDSLTELLRHAAQIRDDADAWLPWTYPAPPGWPAPRLRFTHEYPFSAGEAAPRPPPASPSRRRSSIAAAQAAAPASGGLLPRGSAPV